MRSPIKRFCNYCSYYTRWFWKCHHVRFLLCCAVALIGFVVGIFVAIGREGDVITSNYLELMSQGAFSVFGMFFKQCLITLVMFAVIFLCVLHARLIAVAYIILFFVGYHFGGACVNAVHCNTVLGIIYIIIFLIPINLTTIFSVSIATCGLKGHLVNYGVYRRCSLTCRNTIKLLLKKFCITYVCVIVIYIPFMVVIPCIAQSIMFGFG